MREVSLTQAWDLEKRDIPGDCMEHGVFPRSGHGELET